MTTMPDLEKIVVQAITNALCKAWHMEMGEYMWPEKYPQEFEKFCESRILTIVKYKGEQ